MKNITPFTLNAARFGEIGALCRWAGHCREKWTMVRVSSLVKLHLQQGAKQYGFKSVNDYLHHLEMWSGKIMAHRAAVLDERKNKIV